jgi:hypothetical protein
MHARSEIGRLILPTTTAHDPHTHKSPALPLSSHALFIHTQHTHLTYLIIMVSFNKMLLASAAVSAVSAAPFARRQATKPFTLGAHLRSSRSPHALTPPQRTAKPRSRSTRSSRPSRPARHAPAPPSSAQATSSRSASAARS